MVPITVPTADVYYNVYALSGITSSLILTNHSARSAMFVLSATQPNPSAVGNPCESLCSAFIQKETGKSIWVKLEAAGVILVEDGLSASAPSVIATLPSAMLTKGPEGFRRLRVDQSETSFFLGTSFRSFYALSLSAGTSTTIKFSRATDVVIQLVRLSCEGGSLQLDIYRSPTESGTWGTALPIIAKNEMAEVPSPTYISQSTLTTGGTISGGTLRDVVRIVSPTATAQQVSAGISQDSKRGVGANTVGYYKITNFGNSALTGIFNIEWEERP